MKKSSSRRSTGSPVSGKTGERRRHPRRAGQGVAKAAKKASVTNKASAELEATPSLLPSPECCAHCANPMGPGDRALFVEEEVGRSFCSEDCIGGYFAHEVERLESDYQQRLSSSDLSASEREKLAHLRWPTLREPDEVWREKTLSGDYRYTLISQFHNDKPVWCVCISLFLRGSRASCS